MRRGKRRARSAVTQGRGARTASIDRRRMVGVMLGAKLLLPSVIVGATLAAGCGYYEGTPTVEGVITRDATVDVTKDFVFVKAVPDHPDGFAVTRQYTGIRVFEDSCPVEHLQFPLPFVLFGEQEDVDRTPDPQWRIVVWESDDPYSIWPQPGDAYGTRTFEFYGDRQAKDQRDHEENHGHSRTSFAEDVDLVIDSIGE
jgi:hypothetical protein